MTASEQFDHHVLAEVSDDGTHGTISVAPNVLAEIVELASAGTDGLVRFVAPGRGRDRALPIRDEEQIEPKSGDWYSRSGIRVRLDSATVDADLSIEVQQGANLPALAEELKQRILAVDFNPETLAQLEAAGVACRYGDISNMEALRHHGIEGASVIVSPISDWFLQGTDNLRLLRQVRAIVPRARVIVTADSLGAARALYAEGADYVMVPPVLAAERLFGVLQDTSPAGLARARQRQVDALRAR